MKLGEAMKQKQKRVDDYYANMGHVHTGSLDHLSCLICNPNLPRPKPVGYIYDCRKCGEQFLVHKSKKKKKQLCKNCK